MGIDLFTFVAQIINLLILLFLLRRFLYLPVLKAVINRQRAIASEIRRAERAQRHAAEIEAKCQAEINMMESRKQVVLAAAHEEAEKLLAQLSAENAIHAQEDKKQWKERFQAEQDSFETAVQQLIIKYFNRFANQVVKEMADSSLNEMVIHRFKRKITELSGQEKKDVIAAYRHKKQMTIYISDQMSDFEEKELENFLTEHLKLSKDTHFIFEVRKELISGIAIEADEQLMSWNFESYLQDFRRNLSDELKKLLDRG